MREIDKADDQPTLGAAIKKPEPATKPYTKVGDGIYRNNSTGRLETNITPPPGLLWKI